MGFGIKKYIWYGVQYIKTFRPKLNTKNKYTIRYEQVIVRDKQPVVRVIEIANLSKNSWVGGQIINNKLYMIPCSAEKGIVYDLEKKVISPFGEKCVGDFKWTGGAIYDGNLVCFPRKSGRYFIHNIEHQEISYSLIPYKVNGEHHYGGVLTSDGVVLQPPRDSDYILEYNISKKKFSKIQVSPSIFGLKLRYCGSVLHPNGNVYFLPEADSKVICYTPSTRKLTFIGRRVTAYCFGAQVASDGNIYGFSAYGKGILKINTVNNDVDILFNDVSFGCYGTKIGVDGKLYGIPGAGNKIWQFDVSTGKIDYIYEINDECQVKCAGGAIDKYGNIYCTPASGKRIYIIDFGNKEPISEEQYNIRYDFY